MDSLELLELKLTGKFAQAEAILKQELLNQEDNLSVSNDQFVIAIDNLVNVYLCQRKYQEAKKLLTDIVKQQKIISSNKLNPDLAFTLSRYVEVSHLDTMYPSSFRDTTSLQQLYRKLLAIQEKLWRDNRVEIAYTLLNLATFTVWNDNLKSEREELIHRALLIFHKTLPINSIELANGFSYIESIYRRCDYRSITIPTERIEEIENLLTQALKIYRQQLDTFHPLTLTCLSNLAKIKHELQKYSQAEELASESLSGYQSIFPPQHHYIYQQRLQLVDYLQTPMLTQTPSPEKYQKLLSIQKQLEEDKKYMTKRLKGIIFNDENADTTLVPVEDFFSDYEEEENEEIDWQDGYNDMMSQSRQYLQAENIYVANFLENLAYDSQLNFNFQEAETSHLRALHIRSKLLEKNHPETVICLKNMAYLYRLQQQESLSNYCLDKIPI